MENADFLKILFKYKPLFREYKDFEDCINNREQCACILWDKKKDGPLRDRLQHFFY